MDRRSLLKNLLLAPVVAKPLAKALMAMPEPIRRGAFAQAIITAGQITSIVITNGGSGYSDTSLPIVTFSGSGSLIEIARSKE